MFIILRYNIAGWIMNKTYRNGTDWWVDRPMWSKLANWICPGGIPDSW